jgi:Rap1a immunity proteins
MQRNTLGALTALLIFLISSTNAIGQNTGPSSVQEMIEACKPDSSLQMYCLGVGSGVSVMMMLNSKSAGTYRLCSPRKVTNGQITRIFLNWADRNPKHWDAPAPIGFAIALQEAYPCN